MKEIKELCKKLPRVKTVRINNNLITYQLKSQFIKTIELDKTKEKENKLFIHILKLKLNICGFTQNKLNFYNPEKKLN